MNKEDRDYFNQVYMILSEVFDSKEVRLFLRINCDYVMEAVEFYEREVGRDCKFFKMGIKQIALDIFGWPSQKREEAMFLLRETRKTHMPYNTVSKVHGGSLSSEGVK